jgi:hypothetical protein
MFFKKNIASPLTWAFQKVGTYLCFITGAFIISLSITKPNLGKINVNGM